MKLDILLFQDSNNLDFEAMLHRVITAHSQAILKVFQLQLQRGPTRNVFSPEGKVILVSNGQISCSADVAVADVLQVVIMFFVSTCVQMR
jgi:hypothetical protein